MQRDAILLTIGKRVLDIYNPSGEDKVRRILEGMNLTDRYHWCQLCGSGVPRTEVPYCYLVFAGKIQYRYDVKGYGKNVTQEFKDTGVTRIMTNVNLIYLQGPVIPAPYEIPMKGFQGIRYTELIF